MTTPHPAPRTRRAAALAALAAVLATAAPAAAAPPTAPAPTTAPDYSAVTPTAPYRTATSGKTGGVSWKLLRAPGTLGTTCWRVTTSAGRARTAVPNGPQEARCLPPTPADAEIVDVPAFVQANDRRSKVKFVAVRLPKGTTRTRIGLVGGKVISAPLREGRYLVYVGKGPAPVWVGFRIPGNPPLECGAGALSTRDELIDPVITGNAQGGAWFCDFVDG